VFCLGGGGSGRGGCWLGGIGRGDDP